MKIDKLILALTVIIFGLIGCGTNSKTDNQPNMKLVTEFEIDSTRLVYQYYQKFGFTDVCEDIRMVARLNHSPKFKKKLTNNER